MDSPPPTFIHAYVNDTGFDPALQYASKLNAAGVYVSLRCWGGSGHDTLYTARYVTEKDNPDPPEYVKAYALVQDEEIRTAIKYDLRRNWEIER